jgi:hypothetical protein
MVCLNWEIETVPNSLLSMFGTITILITALLHDCTFIALFDSQSKPRSATNKTIYLLGNELSLISIWPDDIKLTVTLCSLFTSSVPSELYI